MTRRKAMGLMTALFVLVLTVGAAAADATLLLWDGFNEDAGGFWNSSSRAAASHNTRAMYVSEGSGSLRVSLFGVNDAADGGYRPVAITLERPESKAGFSEMAKTMLIDVYVPDTLNLTSIALSYWTYGPDKWFVGSPSVPLQSGWNKDVRFEFDFNWDDVHVLAFSVAGTNLNDDFYIDNVRLVK